MNSDLILLGHGSGGRLSHQLLDQLIIPTLSGTAPADLNQRMNGLLQRAAWLRPYVVFPPQSPAVIWR